MIPSRTAHPGHAGDPLSYPWTPAGRSVLLLPGSAPRLLPPAGGESVGAGRVVRQGICSRPDGTAETLLDEELTARGTAPMAGRTPVAAVGSNASPGVLRAKLRAGGLQPVVPMICGVLGNLRIGFSAHVSRPGFVPAAAARWPGETAPVVVGWLDPDQLARIDATEPNYRRARLEAGDHPLELPGWPVPDTVDLYRSRWGVLGGAGGPLPLRPQSELFALLAGLGLEPWSTLAPEQAAAVLAGSPRVREQARLGFARLGLVLEKGDEVGRGDLSGPPPGGQPPAGPSRTG